jgi:hypothetical protein
MSPSDARSGRSGPGVVAPSRVVACAAVLALLFGAAVAASGRPLEQQPSAQRAARAAVPVSFNEFHGHAATTDYLKRIAAANPGITELLEIGRSAGNRPLYVLVISNMKTGVTLDGLVALQNPRKPAVNNVAPMKPYMGKPGQWIDGGAHGLSLVGTEICLYIIDRLVSGYGSDAEVTRLVDDTAFYVCPFVHPDGSAEPGAPAPRAETASSTDGNYPEGWWRDDNTPGGTGTYPSSSPEARAVLEFFTNHTNILLVQSFHTSGGFTVRPFARWPESRVDPRDAAVFDRVLGKKYLELVGEPVPASWSVPAAAAPDRQAAQAGTQGARRGGAGGAPASGEQSQGRRGSSPGDQPRAWRTAFNQETQTPGGFGVFTDWAFGQFGAYAMSTQAWDPRRENRAVPGEGLIALCEIHWQFERFKASLMPRVAITAAVAKVLYTTNQAVRASVSDDGSTAVVRKAGTAGRYKVVQITATVANSGGLPTQVAQGAQLRGNREDVIWLLGDRARITFLQGSRWLRLGVLQGTLPLPAAAARPAETGVGRGGGGGGRGGFGGQSGASPLSQMRVQRPEVSETRVPGNQRTVTWLVAVDGDAPLKLAVTSQRGGTSVKDLVIQ